MGQGWSFRALNRAVAATIWGEFPRELALPLCTQPIFIRLLSYSGTEFAESVYFRGCLATWRTGKDCGCIVCMIQMTPNWLNILSNSMHCVAGRCSMRPSMRLSRAAVFQNRPSRSSPRRPLLLHPKKTQTKKRRIRVACVLDFEVKDYSSVPSENFVWGFAGRTLRKSYDAELA